MVPTNVRVTRIVLTSDMIRKGYLIVAIVAGTLISAAGPNMRHRLATSTQNFEQRFEELKEAGNSINPIERLLFSLALANTAVEK